MLPEEKEYDPIGDRSIDLGIENIVVDSDKEILESKQVEDIRRRYSRLRSDLQDTGTRSAKRKLKKFGIFGTAALSLSLQLTRVPNGIMSTALIDTNPMALLTEISQFLYIGVGL